MTSLSNIALSGMQAAQTALNVSASNVANLGVQGYHRAEVMQAPVAGGGVSTLIGQAAQPGPALETDLVDQLQAKNAFLANLKVFKTAKDMAGTLLNERA